MGTLHTERFYSVSFQASLLEKAPPLVKKKEEERKKAAAAAALAGAAASKTVSVQVSKDPFAQGGK